MQATVVDQAEPARSVIELRDDWRFRFGDIAEAARQPAFTDTDWEKVSVPHSWNRVGVYQPAVKTRINTTESVNKAMGIGWYRKQFSLPSSAKGRRLWLEFDAASRTASVWLNGQLVGAHEGGYSRFRFDATAAARPGAKNLLVVKTDNSKPAAGSSTEHVFPLAGDFFVPGGLYRPVRVVLADPAHFDLADAGGPGVYVTTRQISAGRAILDIRSRIQNDTRTAQRLTLRLRLRDKSGSIVAEETRAVTTKAGAVAETSIALTVVSPKLWQGVDDPYLYTLDAEILAGNGKPVDAVAQHVGIRKVRFDALKGFFLNGKPYALRGVGYHQDREDKAWSVSAADVEEDVRTLREMGATSIRLTHYQHGQPIHDLADRYGLILWDEVPLVSQWTLGEAKSASDLLRQNARQQMTELVRQNQNHPSVVVWGIANEVDFGNSLPGFLTSFKGTPPDPLPLLRELNSLAKQLDPSRSTALATCCEGRLFAEGVSVPVVAQEADLGGANRYFGWYYGNPGELAGHLDSLRALRPNQPLSITEYGAGGALTVHTDNVLGGPIDSRGRAQPEEFESYVHEKDWAILSQRKDLWGTWLWNSFDFASTVRHEGDADDINTKGLIGYDHKTRKDAYYFYKANWTVTPTVHLNGRRYTDRAYRVTDVSAYSNAPETELFVNGKSVGKLGPCPQSVCVWTAVALTPGDNQLVAQGRFASGQVTDKVAWSLSTDSAQSVRIDAGTMVAAVGGAKRFGSDNFFEGGSAGSVIRPANYGQPAAPAIIGGTSSSAAAATYREGNFRYAIPLPNGRYVVTLTFVEPDAKGGERLFEVGVIGKIALANVDLAAQGASASKAIQRKLPVVVEGGQLNLSFRGIRQGAVVSMIEVDPQYTTPTNRR